MFSLTLLCQVFVFTVYSSHLSLLFPRRSGLVDVCMNKESTFISRLEDKGRTNRVDAKILDPMILTYNALRV